jgi:hypothetical protein
MMSILLKHPLNVVWTTQKVKAQRTQVYPDHVAAFALSVH